MIVASHQPNFMPYMGFFYKMFMCDVFTLSDTVQFSRSGFQNYNFVSCNGNVTKLTVPTSKQSGAIKEVELAHWEFYRRKLWKTLEQNYSKAPHFKELASAFEEIFAADYTYLWELNERIIRFVHGLFGFECEIVKESELGISGASPTAQIADICTRTGCGLYLSGTGAKDYLDEAYLNERGYGVLWSGYKPIDNDLSVFDYLMKHGAQIPPEWVAGKEALCRKGGVISWRNLASVSMYPAISGTVTSYACMTTSNTAPMSCGQARKQSTER